MPIPIIGDLLESTVGKVVSNLADKYLPASMSEAEKMQFTLEARKMAIEEYKTSIADVQDARLLAGKESENAPAWAKALTITNRPIWSLGIFFLFSWTILAPYLGYPSIPMGEAEKSIMQTVIIFYFGGRSIEKVTKTLKENS